MDYFLKANGLIVLWIIFYYLFLNNETFFSSIRVYFLLGLVTIITVPLIEIPIYVEKVVSNVNYYITEGTSTDILPSEQAFEWSQLLTILYLTGVLFFSFKLIIQLFSLRKILTSHNIIRQDKYKFIETHEKISPFSFFNYIIYNKNQFTEDELEQIIKHEKTHVNQWHSIDTLLTYSLQIIFWFNPFAWIFKKTTQQNLEFLADASANEQTDNQKQYQLTLLKALNTHYCQEATNNFYNSLIKKRILMLQKQRSKQFKQLKFALLLPILAIFLMSFNTKEVYFSSNQKTNNKIQNQFVSDIIKIVIDKNTTDAKLMEIKQKLRENGADFSYTVVHNTKNEITNIEVDVKSKYGNVTGSYNFDNTTRIDLKIIITIDNKIGEISLKNNSFESSPIPSNQKTDDLSSWKVTSSKNNVAIVTADTLLINENNEKKLDSLSQWKVTSGRNNVAFATADTLYMYENKNSEFLPGVEEIIGSPLYILDNKESTKEIIENLDSQKIHSVAVLNGNSVIEKYGNKAKDGAIIVKTNNSIQIKQTVELSNLALHILNGREITKEMFEQIIPDDIESVTVLKSDSAFEKYGDKGKNGAIEIKTKATYRSKINFGGKGPLILLDGKEISKKEMENLNPNSVDRINVLKGKASRDKYGNKGKNGVIEITLKKE